MIPSIRHFEELFFISAIYYFMSYYRRTSLPKSALSIIAKSVLWLQEHNLGSNNTFVFCLYFLAAFLISGGQGYDIILIMMIWSQ